MMRSRNDNDRVRELIARIRQSAFHWQREGRLIELPAERAVVFVGDIHGDREAIEQIFERFPPGGDLLVFLGDILDRGPDSLGSLSLLLDRQSASPDDTVLLMGNHEAWAAAHFRPAEFWLGLDPQDAECIADGLRHLPYAAWHPSGVFAAHAALPELPSRQAIDKALLGSAAWKALTWGDWTEDPLARSLASSRPLFGRHAFEDRAATLGVRVMVRSHQPSAPTYLFDDRCLTLFTSTAYGSRARTVARLHPDADIQSARDLKLIQI